MLAAEEDRLQVHVLDALPGLERGVQYRDVVVGADPGVVEEDVDPAHLLRRPRVHLADGVLVGDVGLQSQLALGALGQVHSHDASALLGKYASRLGPDAAGGPRDHADLPVKPAGHQPSVA